MVSSLVVYPGTTCLFSALHEGNLHDDIERNEETSSCICPETMKWRSLIGHWRPRKEQLTQSRLVIGEKRLTWCPVPLQTFRWHAEKICDIILYAICTAHIHSILLLLHGYFTAMYLTDTRTDVVSTRRLTSFSTGINTADGGAVECRMPNAECLGTP